MYDVGYVGYREPKAKIGFGEATLATGGAALPITAVIDIAIAALPFLVPFINNIFAHPARDAKDVINKLKPTLNEKNARERIALIIAAGGKISNKAKDVEAELLHLWYRNAFPNDYMELLRDDKIFYNNYLDSVRTNHADGNNMHRNLISSMFTNDQINYAPPSLVDTTKSLTTKAGLGSIALIGLLGAGIYFFTKKKTA
jgi:hypothetical protein